MTGVGFRTVVSSTEIPLHHRSPNSAWASKWYNKDESKESKDNNILILVGCKINFKLYAHYTKKSVSKEKIKLNSN